MSKQEAIFDMSEKSTKGGNGFSLICEWKKQSLITVTAVIFTMANPGTINFVSIYVQNPLVVPTIINNYHTLGKSPARTCSSKTVWGRNRYRSHGTGSWYILGVPLQEKNAKLWMQKSRISINIWNEWKSTATGFKMLRLTNTL